jgi:hypothetical protein
MDHFAGLDVSVKETSVCIVDDRGRVLREVKVASEPEARSCRNRSKTTNARAQIVPHRLSATNNHSTGRSGSSAYRQHWRPRDSAPREKNLGFGHGVSIRQRPKTREFFDGCTLANVCEQLLKLR